jgi:anaerobic magnesium-protoporphyrin IX monomethyl ester cyclase
MRILLVNPPYIGWLNDLKVEPIGLLYIASFLRQKGHDVALYDPYIGDEESVFIDQVEKWKPDIVACAVYTVSEEFCFKLARLTKQLNPNILFVAGGPHATFAAERMLSRCPEIDLITHKESEEIMLELVERLSAKESVYGIAGTSHKRLGNKSLLGNVVTNATRLPTLPLDELPPPARDMLSWDYYTEEQRSTGVISARGCAYRCDFCVSPVFFKGVRNRQISEVAKEIKTIIDQRKICHVHFYDDVFAYNLKKMKEVRDLIGPLNVTWDCYVRVDCMNDEMLRTMQEAGCIQIRFGVESGVDERRALKKGGKTATFDKHKHVVELARNVGVASSASYILGFPDETRDDILATIDFADKLGTDMVGFYKLTPYPGTIYWKQLEDQNINYETYTKLENDVTLNPTLSADELKDLVRLAYQTYYKERYRPHHADALRFLTSEQKLSY